MYTMESECGILLVLSGPSGTGKGTVAKNVQKRNKNVFFSISATTRKARAGEIDGREYYFMTREEVNKLISEDGMLEYAQYCGNIYGTPKKSVEQQLSLGKDVLLDIEVQGCAQIKEKFPECISIFLLPPSLEVLKQRLMDRNTENEECINKRLKTALSELEYIKNYDYLVVNDNLDSCVDNILSIINSEKHKVSRMKNILREVVEND